MEKLHSQHGPWILFECSPFGTYHSPRHPQNKSAEQRNIEVYNNGKFEVNPSKIRSFRVVFRCALADAKKFSPYSSLHFNIRGIHEIHSRVEVVVIMILILFMLFNMKSRVFAIMSQWDIELRQKGQRRWILFNLLLFSCSFRSKDTSCAPLPHPPTKSQLLSLNMSIHNLFIFLCFLIKLTDYPLHFTNRFYFWLLYLLLCHISSMRKRNRLPPKIFINCRFL